MTDAEKGRNPSEALASDRQLADLFFITNVWMNTHVSDIYQEPDSTFFGTYEGLPVSTSSHWLEKNLSLEAVKAIDPQAINDLDLTGELKIIYSLPQYSPRAEDGQIIYVRPSACFVLMHEPWFEEDDGDELFTIELDSLTDSIVSYRENDIPVPPSVLDKRRFLNETTREEVITILGLGRERGEKYFERYCTDEGYRIKHREAAALLRILVDIDNILAFDT